MQFFVAGVSYKTAPVSFREKFAVSSTNLSCCACRLKLRGGLAEVVLLSTCNRVEVYGVASKVNGNVQDLLSHLISAPVDYSAYLYVHQQDDALQHLFSVVSGMDSMVLGETEITGQVKNAYEAARDSRLTGPFLNRIFQKAFNTAKKVRSSTRIGRGAVSVGSVAVDLAEKIFDGDLSGRSVMILGAGQMGEACVRHLKKRNAASVLVSNRSFERATELASELGGEAIRFEDCFNAMLSADIVVASTGARQPIVYVQDVEQVMKRRRNRPLFLIDISVPRNIDSEVAALPNVYLYNIDHLQTLVRENLDERAVELVRCQQIIQDSTAEIKARINPPREPRPASEPAPIWLFSAPAPCLA